MTAELTKIEYTQSLTEEEKALELVKGWDRVGKGVGGGCLSL